MNDPRFRAGARLLSAIQGLYFLVTGLWPLLHMESFLAITGPKTDLWLVQTVGVVVAAIGSTLALAAFSSRITWEIVLLAVASAVGLTAIDVIFVTADMILPVYLADAAAETVFLCWWLAVVVRGKE